jgi:hypothetical protein
VCEKQDEQRVAAHPLQGSMHRDMAVSTFMCCALGCSNLVGCSDAEVPRHRCLGCKESSYCGK